MGSGTQVPRRRGEEKVLLLQGWTSGVWGWGQLTGRWTDLALCLFLQVKFYRHTECGVPGQIASVSSSSRMESRARGCRWEYLPCDPVQKRCVGLGLGSFVACRGRMGQAFVDGFGNDLLCVSEGVAFTLKACALSEDGQISKTWPSLCTQISVACSVCVPRSVRLD